MSKSHTSDIASLTLLENANWCTLESAPLTAAHNGDENELRIQVEELKSNKAILEKQVEGLRRNQAILEEKLEELIRNTTPLEKQVEELSTRNKVLNERGRKLAQELDMFRQRRLVYWSDRFRNKFDAWHLMHPGFEQLKDDSALFNASLRGYRLLPSLNLLRLPSLCYDINLNREGLSALHLAAIVDMPAVCGQLCCCIKDANGKIIAESAYPLSLINEEEPALLEFESLGQKSLGQLRCQIYVRNVDVPVRIFELRKYPLFGLARSKRKLFAAYSFTSR